MATIINNPSGGDGGSGVGIIVGVVVAVAVIILFFIYGLPALQNKGQDSSGDTNINVELPDTTPSPSQ